MEQEEEMKARIPIRKRHQGQFIFLCIVSAYLAGLAGCVATAPDYSDTAGLQTAAPEGSKFKSLSIGICLSENARKAIAYQTERRNQQQAFGGATMSAQYLEDSNPHYVPEQLNQILRRRFRAVADIQNVADAASQNLDVTMVLDLRVKLGEFTGRTTSVSLSGIFADASGATLDTLAGEGASTRSEEHTSELQSPLAM
jgi:hypothetical protein